MSIVVVATITPQPDAVDAVREALQAAVPAVHEEPGCELYALHQADGTFVFVEQWADADALLVEAQRLMRDRFGIRHTTLQLEASPLADCPGC